MPMFLEKFKHALAAKILINQHFSNRLDLWAIDKIFALTTEERNNYQLMRLRYILGHAYRYIPYWKELLDSLKILPENITTLNQIQQLPILNRDTACNRWNDLYTKSLLDIRTVDILTSGSSAQPIRIYINRGSYLRRSLTVAYYLKLSGLPRVSEHARFFVTPDLGILGTAVNFNKFRSDLSGLCRFLVDKNIRAISAPLSSLMILAEYLSKNKKKLNLKFIHSGAEYMSNATWRFLGETYGCPVYDKYGCQEIGNIGFECAAHQGFHLNPVNLFLEIVDKDGMIVSNQDIGRIVVTSLDNEIMPLFRYDTGDFGRWIEGECSCGLKTPRFNFEGRGLHFFVLPDGNKRSVLFLIDILSQYYIEYIRQMQFVQEAVDRIILRIVPTERYGGHCDIAFIRTILDKLDCALPIKVSVERVSDIPRLSSGKTPIFISRLTSPS